MATIADMIEKDASVPDALTPHGLTLGLGPAPEETGGGLGIDFSFLTRPTGPGPIEDYLDHPMNPKRSRGLAQALRGATGLFGEGLRAALADIVFGGMEYMRERRVEAVKDDDPIS